MAKSASFTVTYDARADVLYISARSVPASRGVEDRYGIVWRYGSAGDLIGATILGFHDLWDGKSEELADQLAARFDIPRYQALNVIEHVSHN